MIAFAYARFSSDNQREESLDAQLRAIHEYAERNGITIVREYKDEAKSATTDRRPAFLLMFDELDEFKPDLLIVHKLDRFSRDRYDSAFYKRILKKAGCRLVSVLEPLDDSPESVILESVLEGMSEYYSRNLARETMKGLTENARNCKHTGGLPPLGFDVGEDKRLKVNKREAEIVRKIFDLYSKGKSYSYILDELKPYRTKAGKPFGKNSLNAILHNEKYVGVFVFGRQSRKFKNSHRSQEEPIRIEDGCPRIISDDIWNAAQERLKASRMNAANKAHREYLLSGKLICGKCGAAMCGQTRKNQKGIEYRFYGCGEKYRTHSCNAKNIPAKDVEERVVAALEDFVELTDEDIDVLYKKLTALSEKVPTEVKELRQELVDINEEISDIHDIERMSPKDGLMFVKRLKFLFSRKEEVEKRLAMMDIRRPIEKEDLKAFVQRLEKIKSLSEDRQKELIRLCIKKVVCKADTFETELCIPKVAGGRGTAYINIVLSVSRKSTQKKLTTMI